MRSQTYLSKMSILSNFPFRAFDTAASAARQYECVESRYKTLAENLGCFSDEQFFDWVNSASIQELEDFASSKWQWLERDEIPERKTYYDEDGNESDVEEDKVTDSGVPKRRPYPPLDKGVSWYRHKESGKTPVYVVPSKREDPGASAIFNEFIALGALERLIDVLIHFSSLTVAPEAVRVETTETSWANVMRIRKYFRWVAKDGLDWLAENTTPIYFDESHYPLFRIVVPRSLLEPQEGPSTTE